MEVWSEDSSLALQACFDCTDGSVFVDSFDINKLTDVVCCYIKFYKDSVIPMREMMVYPYKKPWGYSDTKKTQGKLRLNSGDKRR